MHAIYTLLDVDRPIPPIYQGIIDPLAALSAARTLLR
jgi:oleate hydratase